MQRFFFQSGIMYPARACSEVEKKDLQKCDNMHTFTP
jgi:hypothetical protein